MIRRRGNFNQHSTEHHPDVLSFLRYCFSGSLPESVNVSFSGDVQIAGKSIEIKSCNEWNKSRRSNGTRRRGRFNFKGHEHADYILFVLIRGNGEMNYHLDDAWRYPLGQRFQINWRTFFSDGEES